MIGHSRPTIEADDIAAVSQVLSSGHLAQGKEVRAFEDEVAAFLDLRGGVATSSGTAALHLALLVLGVGPGADVIIPSYACVALLHAVRLAGAGARLVDSEPGGVNAWVDDAARRVSAVTRAIIVPHMFGTVAGITAFRQFGVPVIENCAQALGASRQGRPLGSTGDVTILSFYATKMITTGEGGMVLSNSEGLLREARDLRDYDKRPDDRPRFNYKMTDLQAALGRAQLRKLPRFLERRRMIAGSYDAALRDVTDIYTPFDDGDACYRYVVATPDPDDFIHRLAAHGVECQHPVFRPIHEIARVEGCPNAASAYQRAVSLPLYPSLTDGEAALIRQVAVQTLARRGAHDATRSLSFPAG